MRILQVKNKDAGQRIDKYLRKYLNNAPLSYIYKLFRKKDIKVNGKRVDINYILKENDEIKVYISEETFNDFNSVKQIANTSNTLDIIYEDSNIIIINKEAGILVHPGDENDNTNTLNNDILFYLKNKGEYNETDLFTPSCVHRLDRNTTGLIVAAKTLEASKQLLDLFKDKEILQKEYIALVTGNTNNEETINKPLLKDEKKKFVKVSPKGLTALTKYKKLTSNNECSLINVTIMTGRTHQIRVHMASIGHPVINDDKYGDFPFNKSFQNKFKYKYQFLHSYKLTFKNIEGTLSYLSNTTFTAPLKKEENNIINNLFPSFKLK